MPREMSKTQIDRLGDRLKKGVVGDDDLRTLDEYRDSFDPAYEIAIKLLRDKLGLEPTGRRKSRPSILDKLRRERTRLSQMQDIAGCRVVVATIINQNALIEKLTEAFSDVGQFGKPIIIDRRSRPSHGYRAVHAVVASLDKRVEIQIRTEMQHRWAEASEKAADALQDISIKYGGGDIQVHGLLLDVSSLIFEMEDFELLAHDKIECLMPIASMDVDAAERMINEIRNTIENQKKQVDESLDDLFDTIKELA